MLSLTVFNLIFDVLFFFLVVGEKEKNAGTVNVRTRDNIVHGEFSVGDVIKKFQELKEKRILASEDTF